MKVDTITYKEINRPMYILEEERLRRNLTIISDVAKRADVEIILAFKAYALWKTFPIFKTRGGQVRQEGTHILACLYRLRD